MESDAGGELLGVLVGCQAARDGGAGREAAVVVRAAGVRLGERAGVGPGGAVLGDRAVRGGEIGLAERVPGGPGIAGRIEEGGGGGGEALEVSRDGGDAASVA